MRARTGRGACVCRVHTRRRSRVVVTGCACACVLARRRRCRLRREAVWRGKKKTGENERGRRAPRPYPPHAEDVLSVDRRSRFGGIVSRRSDRDAGGGCYARNRYTLAGLGFAHPPPRERIETGPSPYEPSRLLTVHKRLLKFV